MKKERIAYLVRQYREGLITESETIELQNFIQDNESDLTEGILADMEDIEAKPIAKEEWKEWEEWEAGLRMILEVDRRQETGVRRLYRWIAVAASIVILLGVWYFNREASGVRREQTSIVQNNDVPAPDTTKATITLANGKVIVPKIVNGEVEKGQWAVGNGQYEVLNNPRGSQIVSIELSDGTKVWLNSESTLKYPVNFTAKERRVTLTGEGYFEVAKESKKFFVETNGVQTEVLGTHFNINSYENPVVTLLEGSIRVYSAPGVYPERSRGAVKLKPGEQVQTHASRLTIHDKVDVDAIIAWKNGMFQFDKSDTRTVMKQLERWYDIEVKYQSSIPEHSFIGQIDRSLSLVKVLNILAKSGLKFKVEDKVLTIL